MKTTKKIATTAAIALIGLLGLTGCSTHEKQDDLTEKSDTWSVGMKNVNFVTEYVDMDDLEDCIASTP